MSHQFNYDVVLSLKVSNSIGLFSLFFIWLFLACAICKNTKAFLKHQANISIVYGIRWSHKKEVAAQSSFSFW